MKLTDMAGLQSKSTVKEVKQCQKTPVGQSTERLDNRLVE